MGKEYSEEEEESFRQLIIKDAHMMVLDKIRSGDELNWLDRNVLEGLLGERIAISEEVKTLVKEMKAKGELDQWTKNTPDKS